MSCSYCRYIDQCQEGEGSDAMRNACKSRLEYDKYCQAGNAP
ncbi:hypothetical protein EDC26_10142 [Paralcaligenes ureilyticus]|uniref:Uncharacterized protein n=1 Tax=Paralcaligenes ureilyticus TaxID=627131 RepID=A0A4R3MD48_9BURK|nr:hypothetical protein EDC26_10142 [Paralcaligenes ureilyticus]